MIDDGGAIVDLADRRFAVNIRRLHALGPRPLYEMLVVLGAERRIRSRIEQLVRQFAQIDGDVLAFVGGRDLPDDPPPPRGRA